LLVARVGVAVIDSSTSASILRVGVKTKPAVVNEEEMAQAVAE